MIASNGLNLRHVGLRKLLADKPAAIRIVLYCIFDVARFGIEADVIDLGHIVQNISRAAADIEDTLSRPKLQNVIKANLPQPVGAENALPADIERWRAQETVQMEQVSLMGPLPHVKGLPAACRYFRVRDGLERNAIAKVVFRLSHSRH